MKTYWLVKRTAATSSFLPQSTSQMLSPMNPSSRRGSSLSDVSRTGGRSAAYTPVTFDSVSKSHASIKSLLAAAYAEEDGYPEGTGGPGDADGRDGGRHGVPEVGGNEVVTAHAQGAGCRGSGTCAVM